MHVSFTAALLLATAASAQVYGTGALGAFAPTANTTLDTTANGGVFDFTSISIPAGVTVKLSGPNPAILLCQGAVSIAGSLDASAANQTASGTPPTPGGPGGYDGGPAGQPGGGFGGGAGGGFGLPASQAGNGSHATSGGFLAGPTYGTTLPFDLRGGSGGGGVGFASFSIPRMGATGGGGTVVLLAAGPIDISGAILARGGTIVQPPVLSVTHGGIGAGGSILIRSLQSVQIGGTVDARGGDGPFASGGNGFVRIDGYAASGAPSVTGFVQPSPFVAPLPYLTTLAPAQIGHVYPIRVASAPGDDVTLYVSLGTASIPIPPFGVVELDPTMLWSFGNHTVPATGHDPLAAIDIPIPSDTWLIGVTFYAQVINNIGSVAGLPQLSNRLTIGIGP